MTQLISMVLIGAAIVLVLFTATWIVQLKTKNAGIVDTVWSFSFPVLALTYFSIADGFFLRKVLIVTIVGIWGLRLAVHLLIRTLAHEEDARYTTLRKEWGDKQNIFMLRFFYFQAILALLLSLPFALIVINPAPTLKTIEIIGTILWFFAVTGESVADFQLKKFKENPSNKGKVCDTGLWYYSRHPNYFFEWMIWVSYFIIALGSDWGFLSIISPIAILYFLLSVTGIPYTEKQSLKSKGLAYVAYQETTSPFIPWRKRNFKAEIKKA